MERRSRSHGGVLLKPSAALRLVADALMILYGHHQAHEGADGTFMKAGEGMKRFLVSESQM